MPKIVSLLILSNRKHYIGAAKISRVCWRNTSIDQMQSTVFQNPNPKCKYLAERDDENLKIANLLVIELACA
jgi:hypothetical protein